MRRLPTLLITLATLAATGPAAHAADTPDALATKAGCTACHAADRKLVGPSWKDVAARYKGDAKAPATLTSRVRQGSKDMWGPVPMAPTDKSKLGDAELKAVVAWILKS